MNVGDKVRISPTASANPRYRDRLGVGTIVRITDKRVIVRWSGLENTGRHTRAIRPHMEHNLEAAG
jgi:hypothetical protein